MSMNLSYARIACVALALFVPCLAGPRSAQAQPADGTPITVYPRQATPQAGQRPADALLQKARQRGRIRVIVGLDVAMRDEDELSPAEQTRQGQVLAIAQTNVARRGVIPANQIVRFETIPFMSAFVTRAQLQRLLNDPQVTSIQEDLPILRPMLADSTKIIKANAVWNRKGYTGQGMTVAVLDTGAQYSHPMIKASKVVAGFCRSTNGGGAQSLCPNGVESSNAKNSGRNCDASIFGCDHGTHVSGIAVGKGGGLRGVAPDATLISGQVFSRFQGGNCTDAGLPSPCALTDFSDVTAGLERVFQLRNQYNIASVNMSLGGGIFDSACDNVVPALTAIVKKLSNNNNKIGVVAASGNDFSNDGIGAPACISRAVAVGSTTKADKVSRFSNHHELVDLMAPGSNIRSSVPGGGFARFSGTSMATPHVAGAWALMKQARPNATVNQVRNALRVTGVDVTRAGVTKPRINVFRAINRLENVVPAAVAAAQ